MFGRFETMIPCQRKVDSSLYVQPGTFPTHNPPPLSGALRTQLLPDEGVVPLTGSPSARRYSVTLFLSQFPLDQATIPHVRSSTMAKSVTAHHRIAKKGLGDATT